MTLCPNRQQLHALVANELTDDERVDIEDHLEVCSICQAELETWDSLFTPVSVRIGSAIPPHRSFGSNQAFASHVSPDLQKSPGSHESFESRGTQWNPALIDRWTSAVCESVENLKLATESSHTTKRIGDYLLLEQIGQGGMGIVYRARHTRLDKIVAVKMLASARMNDAASRARFEREMRAVGLVEHPHLVRAMDAGVADGTPYLVMEYINGVDLGRLSGNGNFLPIPAACELIRQAALGLEAAWEHGIVHRDIKPSNLALARQRSGPPILKILDMGLALFSEKHSPAASDITFQGQILGSLDYMSPEQGGDSKNVDIRADLYSLGATLYRLLCGETVFQGAAPVTPIQKMMALANHPAPPIQARREGIPNELAAIVHRLLEKDPGARYATPQAVADALLPFSAGADLQSLLAAAAFETTDGALPPDPESLGLPNVRWTKQSRRRLVAFGIGGLVSLFLLMTAIIVYFDVPGGGTLRVEFDDPSFEVVVKGQNVVLKKFENKEIMLTPGPHSLIVKRGDFQFETTSVIFKKDQTSTVRVELLPGKVRVVKDGHLIGEERLPQSSVAENHSSVVPTTPKPSIKAPWLSGAYAGEYALWFPPNKDPKISGSEGHVTVPTLNHLEFREKSITLEAWLKRDPKTERAHRAIFGFPGEFHISTDAAGFCYACFGAAVQSRYRGEEAEFQWTHIAIVKDMEQSAVRLFINGRKVDTIQYMSGQIRGHHEVLTFSHQFSGWIGESRVSSIARYEKDFTPQVGLQPDEQTVALYKFEEGSGEILKDSSGNRHHGKIVAAEWVLAKSLNDSIPLKGP